MTSTSHRFTTLRASTNELLAAGEQPHIEFKREVIIGEVAKQAAAGANYVAHQPSAKVYTIIFGAEEISVGGVKVGSVVGLLDGNGDVLDLDAVGLQIGQAIHDTVIPPPAVAMYEENVGTKPILVVEVRPTTAPHVVRDRWNIRGVRGIQPMKQDQALQIFKNQRLSAWIEEFEGSDPLKGALRALQASIDDLRWRAFTTDDDSTERADFAPMEEGIRALDDMLQSLDSRVGEVLDSVEILKTQSEEILGSFSQTAEDAWWAVMKSRQMRMITLHSSVTNVSVERTELLDKLFDDYLGEKADPSSYPANVAESASYRTLRRGDSNMSPAESAASDLVSAALWRINGMPRVFGIGWVEELRDSTDLLSRESVRSEWVKGVDAEIGLLYLPHMTKEILHPRLGSRLASNQRILSIPTSTGVYRIGVPEAAEVWPIVFAPGVHIDTKASSSISATVETIQTLVAETGGSSWCVEGPGIAIPTSGAGA